MKNLYVYLLVALLAFGCGKNSEKNMECLKHFACNNPCGQNTGANLEDTISIESLKHPLSDGINFYLLSENCEVKLSKYYDFDNTYVNKSLVGEGEIIQLVFEKFMQENVNKISNKKYYLVEFYNHKCGYKVLARSISIAKIKTKLETIELFPEKLYVIEVGSEKSINDQDLIQGIKNLKSSGYTSLKDIKIDEIEEEEDYNDIDDDYHDVNNDIKVQRYYDMNADNDTGKVRKENGPFSILDVLNSSFL